METPPPTLTVPLSNSPRKNKRSVSKAAAKSSHQLQSSSDTKTLSFHEQIHVSVSAAVADCKNTEKDFADHDLSTSTTDQNKSCLAAKFYSNIYLAGGNTLFPGLAEETAKSLKLLVGPDIAQVVVSKFILVNYKIPYQ